MSSHVLLKSLNKMMKNDKMHWLIAKHFFAFL